MILSRLRCFYHLRKPRIPSEVDRSFKAYKVQLRRARKQVHKESVLYLNQIEDTYLQEHHQAMKKQHFQNECSFRKQIFTDSYRLSENQSRWTREDQRFTSAVNKYLHDEDVRKINRSRIMKIMEHESNHYWFNSQNVDTRLKEETIFPEYVASSEYYYRLFAEAMAYELGDFHELHLVTSNEEIIRQKNKYLIPLYLTLRNKISDYSRNPEQELRSKMAYEVNLVKNNSNYSSKEGEELTQKIQSEYNSKLKQVQEENSGESSEGLLKRRLKELISIFKTWKEYTNVLALTSAQVINSQFQNKNESWIQNKEKEVLVELKKQKGEAFIDSIEEDTEEIEMSFEEYLAKIKQQRKETQLPDSESSAMEQLDILLAQTDSLGEEISLEQQPLDLSGLVTGADTRQINLGSSDQLNPMFFNPKETTASVQILKSEYKDDAQLLSLLNQLGQIDVRYPKLFQQIWKSCIE